MAKNAVTTKEESKLPAAMMDQLAADAGMGAESATTEDMIIPFVKLAQALSPEINKRESVYIDGLEQGDFFNAATERLWKGETGLMGIPVLFQRKYLEWVPRDNGGGFAGEHDASIMDKCKVDDNGAAWLDNGNEIVVTGTWYFILFDPATMEAEQAVVSLSKSQLKKSRALMTKLKTVQVPHPSGKGRFNPAMFFNVVKVTSVPESNDQGNWFGWKFELAGNVFQYEDGAELYDGAKALLEAVRSGNARAADPVERNDSPSEPAGDGSVGNAKADEEIPF